MKWGVGGEGKGDRGKGIVFLIYLDDQKWKGKGEWNDQGLITSLDVGRGY
jgi:hypothetical protein